MAQSFETALSARAAENSRTGNETNPKLMKPFQTVAGIVHSSEMLEQAWCQT